MNALRPALWTLRGYSGRDLVADVSAGVSVGLVALPLAMAFGIASGVTPQAGLYTAIVGGLIVACFGGSRVQIAGPTGAFVVIVAGIVARYGVNALAVITMMAGVLLALLGVLRLGRIVNFIPYPIVVGFTNGIALLIASTQIEDALGLRVPGHPISFLARMHAIATHLGTIHPATAAITIVTIAVLLVLRKVAPRVPGAVVALLAVTPTAAGLHLSTATIGTRFGGIPAGLPHPALPAFDPHLILPLLPSAFTVAILGAVESLLSAVVGDALTGGRHNANAELFAQGLANVASPLFGGIPVTGAIARTGTNVRAGARSPVAAIVHALTLLAIVVALAPLASFIPLASLAAILLVVAYNIGEWHVLPALVRLNKTDAAVWAVTFTLTVCTDLTVAVGGALVMAALLAIYRLSQTTTVTLVTPDYIERGRAHSLQEAAIPPYVSIVRIHGPFLFGATEQLLAAAAALDALERVVIVRLRNMTAIDATGIHALATFRERLRHSGRTMLLCGAPAQPAKVLARAGFIVLPDIASALASAAEHMPATVSLSV